MIELLAAVCSALLSTPVLTWIVAGAIFMAIENVWQQNVLQQRARRSSRWLNVQYGIVHAVAIAILSPLCNVARDEAINLVSTPERPIDLFDLAPESEHRNKNFAAYFPIWDRLFGTLHVPQPGERPTTGPASKERMESVFLLAFYPFVALLGRVRASLPGHTGATQPGNDVERA